MYCIMGYLATGNGGVRAGKEKGEDHVFTDFNRSRTPLSGSTEERTGGSRKSSKKNSSSGVRNHAGRVFVP